MMQRITPGVASPTNITTTPAKVANAARTRHQTSVFEVSPRTRIGLDIRKIQSDQSPRLFGRGDENNDTRTTPIENPLRTPWESTPHLLHVWSERSSSVF